MRSTFGDGGFRFERGRRVENDRVSLETMNSITRGILCWGKEDYCACVMKRKWDVVVEEDDEVEKRGREKG